MYPRNAASPPRIAIGAVVQISDGAVQGSGVSVVVRAEGGSETAGSGTVSYGGSSSIVYYAPAQGETDYTAFVVAAYKTGCIPVAQTIITSASATAGYAGTDQSKIANATATVDLSNTTIKNLDGNTVQTGDAYDIIKSGGAGDAAAIKAKTDNLPSDPADESLIIAAADALSALIGTPVTSVAADIAAVKAVDDAIKSKTDNLPASPAAVGDIPTAADNADAVWDEAIADHTGVGSTGEALSAAGAAGDPWATALPGLYGPGTAGKIIGDNIDAAISDIPTATENADALLDRDMSAGADNGSASVRTPRQALRFPRNKFALTGNALTVYKEDDATVSWSGSLTTDANAEPIVGGDPAGP